MKLRHFFAGALAAGVMAMMLFCCKMPEPPAPAPTPPPTLECTKPPEIAGMEVAQCVIDFTDESAECLFTGKMDKATCILVLSRANCHSAWGIQQARCTPPADTGSVEL